eukprot:TRINITY_DN30698_c0_g1_i1.p3 TRINITY_DN30698_c0_g1~~TRINITY_DN30698_c0_g1_i1.p3  ORF type:complete len:107 (-),score=26.69 TRINITY_DN30698_c0_g1_i1:166-486(-)
MLRGQCLECGVLRVLDQSEVGFVVVFFFSSRRRHTRCREVSWARRCVQETGTWGHNAFCFVCSAKRSPILEHGNHYHRPGCPDRGDPYEGPDYFCSECSELSLIHI